ncbi:uncharacterized protein METZ01_LOCUS440109, partial [marine metagenome]
MCFSPPEYQTLLGVITDPAQGGNFELLWRTTKADFLQNRTSGFYKIGLVDYSLTTAWKYPAKP